jgi:hypothetical protein
MPLELGLAVAAIVIVAGGIMLRRNLAALSHHRWIVWTIVGIGIVAGVPLGSMASHQDAHTQVYGIPLTVVILELHNGQWLDYLSFMTPVGFVVNTLTWAAVSQVVLATGLFLFGKRRRPLRE